MGVSEGNKDLFTPIQFGDLQLPNRIIMAPLTRGRAGKTYNPNELMQEYYTQRASSGLIITEATHISLYGRGWYEAPEIYTDEHVTEWKKITDSVHKAGGRIFCQLWHTGRTSHSSFRVGIEGYEGDKALSIAPSGVKRKSHGTTQKFTPGGEDVPIETPREMSKEDINNTIEEYSNASKKAKEAGFDGVEIHSANGYLLDEFLQSCSNLRTDEYGGSFENRFRLVKQIIEKVMEDWKCTEIGIRLSPNSSFNGMGSEDNYEAFMYYTKQLDTFNLAYLHVLVGEGFAEPHGLSKNLLAEDYRSEYKGNIMVNVGFTKESGNEIIESGNADLVSFGRLFISNPDLVERFKSNAALNQITDPSTLYSSVSNHPKGKGYVDYPTM